MTRKKWVAALPLIIFGLLALFLIVGLHHHSGGVTPKNALHVGDVAPVTDLPVLGQSNTRFTAASWRGRPYIVNFFASWCPSCHAEHEEMMTLQAGHIPIIGIATRDHADNTSTYLDHDGNPFIVVAGDEDAHAWADWGLAEIPETFVVDAQGVIRWHYVGPITEDIAADELMPVWENVSSGAAR